MEYLGGHVSSSSEDEPRRYELAPLLQEVHHLSVLKRAPQAQVLRLHMAHLHAMDPRIQNDCCSHNSADDTARVLCLLRNGILGSTYYGSMDA